MKRRDFIKNASFATAGITFLNFPVFGKNAPANKVQLAVMGVNSRGQYLAEMFAGLPNVEIAYLCDVEEKAIAKGLKPFANASKKPTVSLCWMFPVRFLTGLLKANILRDLRLNR